MTATKQTLPTGTRIELNGTPAMGGFPAVAPEKATIGRWSRSCDDGTGINNIRGRNGWHIVRFSDGARLMCHESGFRVIDNRVRA